MAQRGIVGTAVVVALAVGAFVVEQKYLRGHVEYRESFDVRDGDELYIEIDKPGVEHTLEIWTGKETTLEFTLLNPDGVEVLSDTELTSHKGKRLHDFMPYAEGEWTLYIDRRALSRTARGTYGSGTVSVLTGDKRPFSCQM